MTGLVNIPAVFIHMNTGSRRSRRSKSLGAPTVGNHPVKRPVVLLNLQIEYSARGGDVAAARVIGDVPLFHVLTTLLHPVPSRTLSVARRVMAMNG